jgi:hypothetical protein
MLDNITFEIGPPVGAFERSYHIPHTLTAEQKLGLIEWLAKSLLKNFILLEKHSTTLAGGYSDNFSAWEAGRFNREEPLTRTIEYELRLHQEDLAMFEMVWHKNIAKVDKDWFDQ